MYEPSGAAQGIRKIFFLNINGFLLSFVVLSICSLIGLFFHLLGLSEANIITIYILGIIIISCVASKSVYGIFSSFVGVLLFNCLYAIPRFNLFYFDPQYSITTIIMLLVSLVVSYAMGQIREQFNQNALHQYRSEVLLETSQSLLLVQNTEEITEVVFSQMQKLMNRTAVVFPVEEGVLLEALTREAEGGYEAVPKVINDDRRVISEWLENHRQSRTCACIHALHKTVYFTIATDKTVYAVIGILIPKDGSIRGFTYNLIAAMLDEIALAMEKNILREKNEKILLEAETERLHNNLLRSVSHNLRTPLTSISGNADILLSSEEQIEPAVRRQIYQDIYSDTEWLIQMIENLLFISRIDKGKMPVLFQPELLQEVIPDVVHSMGRQRMGRRITVDMPDELLMVDMDVRLFIQLLINLADNALKFSPPDEMVEIRLFRRDERAVIEVADRGRGVPEQDKERIFDIYYTRGGTAGDHSRGIGLGLFLCRVIADAHGGELYVRGNDPHGAVFGISLPIKEVHIESEHTGN